MIQVQFLAGARDFSLLQHVQTSSKAHPASYSMGMGVPSQGVRWPWHEIDHSPPATARVKNMCTA